MGEITRIRGRKGKEKNKKENKYKKKYIKKGKVEKRMNE